MQIWLDRDDPEQLQLIRQGQQLGGHVVNCQDEINPDELLVLTWANCQQLTVPVRQAIVWLPVDLPSIHELQYSTSKMGDFVIVVASDTIKYKLVRGGFAAQQVQTVSLPGIHLGWVADQSPVLKRVVEPLQLTTTSIEEEAWRLHRQGGFALVGDDRQSRLHFSISMAAGVPVAVVKDNVVLAQLVTETKCGIVYKDQATLNQAVANLSPDDYQAYSRHARQNAQRISAGISVRHGLLRSIDHLLSSHDYSNDQPRYGIHVMNSSQTLDYIAQHHCSVARLGDGEISLLLGTAQVFQDEDPLLRKRLDEIVKTPSDDHLLVCLSDTFHDLGRYVPAAQDWWNGHLNVFRDYYQKLGRLGYRYGNTMVTRAYMDLQDRTAAGEIFARIKQWWQDRDVLIVEGRFTRSGVGNDLYDNAKSVQRIICPPKNAWAKYQEIEAAIKHYGKGKLVLVMLGMAATVIAADLADWGQVIDSGHLDPEYEWYQMGATERVPIQGKHTAEMNYDQGVPEEIADPQYQSQIVLNLDD